MGVKRPVYVAGLERGVRPIGGGRVTEFVEKPQDDAVIDRFGLGFYRKHLASALSGGGVKP